METEKKQVTSRIDILKKLVVLLEPWLDDIDESARINEQANLLTNMGLDSVAILQLILGIEDEFSIIIQDNELDSEMFSRMGNLIDIIESKVNENN